MTRLCFPLFAFVLAVTGCATVHNGRTQAIRITSNPSGANVKIDSESYGQTPVTVNMKRYRGNQVVLIEKQGFRSFEQTFRRRVSGWYWGNFILGGAIGLIVDPITGGMFDLVPSNIHAELQANE